MFTAGGGVWFSGCFSDGKLRTTEGDCVGEEQESGHDTYVQGILSSLRL